MRARTRSLTPSWPMRNRRVSGVDRFLTAHGAVARGGCLWRRMRFAAAMARQAKTTACEIWQALYLQLDIHSRIRTHVRASLDTPLPRTGTHTHARTRCTYRHSRHQEGIGRMHHRIAWSCGACSSRLKGCGGTSLTQARRQIRARQPQHPRPCGRATPRGAGGRPLPHSSRHRGLQTPLSRGVAV